MVVPSPVPLLSPASSVTSSAHTGKHGPHQRVHETCPSGGGGHRTRHSSQQDPEPAPAPNRHGGSQLAGYDFQPPRLTDHLNRFDLNAIEAISAGDEAGDLVTRGNQQPCAVGRLDHDVADGAEGRHRPSSDNDAVARCRAKCGDFAVKAPAYGYGRPPLPFHCSRSPFLVSILSSLHRAGVGEVQKVSTGERAECGCRHSSESGHEYQSDHMGGYHPHVQAERAGEQLTDCMP